jgi:S-adenosylmethionine:tRNA ribosyltransferase-isomerase
MRLSDFDYELPEWLIAQQPLEPRDAARLLVLHRATNQIEHRHVRDLTSLLRAGDLLVANRSRVLPARIRGRLHGGGQAELLLLKRLGDGHWEALARPARRLRPGDAVTVNDALSVRIVAAAAEGVRVVEPVLAGDVVAGQNADAALLAAGSVPVPPYIRGWIGDPDRYQTIFADVDGSAAAPTAGLHFTRGLLDRLASGQIGFTTLVLHVGLDTFRPVAADDPRHHHMHREWYDIPATVQAQIAATRASGGRIVAVGTTVVRALEAWARSGQTEDWTDLFITPGFQFNLVDALLTNFHLPRSTLLMLVSAFAGRDHILAAYEVARAHRYRFYSFGDAMLLL